jgi:hypothetical protein
LSWASKDGQLDIFTLPGTVRISSGVVNLARRERRIRYQIEMHWIRDQCGNPSHHLADLAKRLHVV